MRRQAREDCPEAPNPHLHLWPLKVAGCVLLVAAALGRGLGHSVPAWVRAWWCCFSPAPWPGAARPDTSPQEGSVAMAENRRSSVLMDDISRVTVHVDGHG